MTGAAPGVQNTCARSAPAWAGVLLRCGAGGWAGIRRCGAAAPLARLAGRPPAAHARLRGARLLQSRCHGQSHPPGGRRSKGRGAPARPPAGPPPRRLTRTADRAAKKGAPVYSRQPPTTPTLPFFPLWESAAHGVLFGVGCVGGWHPAGGGPAGKRAVRASPAPGPLRTRQRRHQAARGGHHGHAVEALAHRPVRGAGEGAAAPRRPAVAAAAAAGAVRRVLGSPGAAAADRIGGRAEQLFVIETARRQQARGAH